MDESNFTDSQHLKIKMINYNLIPSKKDLEQRRGWLSSRFTPEPEKIQTANWLERAHREIIDFGYEKWKMIDEISFQ